MADDAALRSALRGALAATPSLGAELPERLDALVDEFMPFAERAREAIARDDLAATDARALAWLFAYRVGDLGYPAPTLTAALFAWRDHGASAPTAALCEQMLPVMLDGYARAREDRAKSEMQTLLAAATPVATLGSGVLLVTAVGPLDVDAATAIAERAGQTMLRSEARAVLLDLTGVADAAPSVVAALWAIASSARMLGAHAVMVGDAEALRDSLSALGGERSLAPLVPTLAAGLERLARVHGVALAEPTSWRDRLERAVRDALGRVRSGT